MHLKSVFLLTASLFSTTYVAAQDSIQCPQVLTSMPLKESNVVWRQDYYREVDLHNPANAALFTSAQQSIFQKGLFERIMRLAVEKVIPIYTYAIDGNESFSVNGQADIRDIMRNHGIYFSEENGRLSVDPEDLPSEDIKRYYVRETVVLDASNGSFRRIPTALCPVLDKTDDFSFEQTTHYPLFWVEYADIEQYLRDITVAPSEINSAYTMSLSDYLTTPCYQGGIYKVANVFGRTLRQINPTDSLFAIAQQDISRRIKDVHWAIYQTTRYSYYKKQ